MPLIDAGARNKRVSSPSDGRRYVYCDGSNAVPIVRCDNGASGPSRHTTIMAYPIIETDRGTIINFKNRV